MIFPFRYALLLRHTSSQSYRMLLEQLPLPSIELLKKLSSGDLDSWNIAEKLRKDGHISSDITLMVDEMFLRKLAQYFAGDYIGENEDGKLFSGIVCFMIVGIKQSIPFVVQSSPETTVTGKWLKEQLDDCITKLMERGFKVRAVVADNHKSNVSAFTSMLKSYAGEDDISIYHPAYKNEMKTYLLYDMVHIIKNIRNNLLSSKKFVFPEFSFDKFRDPVNLRHGSISWSLLHRVYEEDAKLGAGLKQARKLNHSVLHPGNNKQDVSRALAIFDETTSAGIKGHFPSRDDAANFLNLMHKVFLVCNAKAETHGSDALGDAAKSGDGKVEFLREVAAWIEEWSTCSDFALSTPTSKAIVISLRAQASLIEDLLSEGYKYVMTVRFQSDALERRYSRYRQMNGGNFLVSLSEVKCSEKILLLRTMVKEGINFWEDDVKKEVFKATDHDALESFHVEVSEMFNEIAAAQLSQDTRLVSQNIAGYIARQIQKRFDCEECSNKVEATDKNTIHSAYINLLSRGGLKHPSESLADFVATGFAILDTTSGIILKYSKTFKSSMLALEILNNFNNNANFSCDKHLDAAKKLSSKTIVNIFYNNKRLERSALERKQAVVAFKSNKRSKKAKGED